MKRAAKLGWLLLAVLCLVILPGAISWLRLPKFNGRSVRYWFNQDIELRTGRFDPGRGRRIDVAFQGMGADAAGFLVEQLRLWDAKTGQLRSPSRFPWNRLSKIRRPNFLATAVRDQINEMRGRDDQRFTRATELLARLGPKLARVQGPLGQALFEVPDMAKREVLHLFWLMGPAGSNSVGVVADCFWNKDSSIRNEAVSAFEAITPAGSPDLELLRRAVAERRVRAARGISALARSSGQFVDLLTILGEELSTNSTNKLEALQVAKQLKADRTALIDPLMTALQDGDPRCRAAVLQSMQTLDRAQDRWVDAAADLLNDEYSYVRTEAARALGHAGPNGRKALPRLKQHEKDTNEETRAAIQEAEKAILEGH
jgi:hypothetical protein